MDTQAKITGVVEYTSCQKCPYFMRDYHDHCTKTPVYRKLYVTKPPPEWCPLRTLPKPRGKK